MGLIGAQRFPLVGSQDGTQTEKHAGVCLFELRARLGDTIDLCKDLGLVRLIGGQQGLHRRLLFPNTCAEIEQGGAVLLEDGFHLLLLV